jgi:geranylgeranyl reductase family protein
MITGANVFDVAIVGAGPAGSAAAYHLAKSRRRVLLIERSSFPRDKACGDGLTRTSVKLLAEMGLTVELAKYQRVEGIRIGTDSKGYQDRKFETRGPGWPDYGVVIPRSKLDHLICTKAVEAGASLLENTTVTGPILKNERVCGVRIRRNGTEEEVPTSFVIAADGGNSYFARKIGLFEENLWSRGFAIRGYFTDVIDIENLFKVYVPLLDPDENRALGGYGWVFPLGEQYANIGVGFFPTQQQDFRLNLRRVFDHFLKNLSQTDPRLSNMRLVGSLKGALLPCGMNPSKCVGKGVILVGDAAGLVDPFTGEGINTALESGRLAASVLENALGSSDPMQTDLTEYSRLLENGYRERFQVGKRFVKTYGFMWKLLENTFDIQRPLFASVRSALMDFGSHNHNRHGLVPPQFNKILGEAGVLEELKQVQDEVGVLIHSEFPLLTKVSSDLVDPTGRFLRSTLVFLSSRFGESDRSTRIIAATAIELACLAYVINDNVLDNTETQHTVNSSSQQGRVNWANMFAVMAGNFLLAKAFELTTQLGHEINQMVSSSSGEVCVGKMLEIEWSGGLNQSEERYLDIIEKKTAILYELSCRIGAMLSDVPAWAVDAIAAYGQNVGMAYQLTNDILNSKRAGKVESETVSNPLEKACFFVDRSKDCLAALPCSPINTVLEELCQFVIERAGIADSELAISRSFS